MATNDTECKGMMAKHQKQDEEEDNGAVVVALLGTSISADIIASSSELEAEKEDDESGYAITCTFQCSIKNPNTSLTAAKTEKQHDDKAQLDHGRRPGLRTALFLVAVLSFGLHILSVSSKHHHQMSLKTDRDEKEYSSLKDLPPSFAVNESLHRRPRPHYMYSAQHVFTTSKGDNGKENWPSAELHASSVPTSSQARFG